MSAATVLVVDDDPVVLQLLKVNLELEGYRVLTAEDGESCLAYARTERPQAIVLDVMMPGLSGLDVAAKLRAGSEFGNPGIMFVSAKAQGADVSAGLELADDYITKPFDSLDLLERVAALVAATDGPPGPSRDQ